MPRFEIGLSHHSISRSRTVTHRGSLSGAKRKATREFGDGFQDHTIVVMDADGYTAARRLIRDRRWQDY